MKEHIRQALPEDAVRLAEIEIFNYRLHFYPIFRNDDFYFRELNTADMAEIYRTDPALLARTYVWDDGVVGGFCRIDGTQLEKLFVEPVLQSGGIGGELLAFACEALHVTGLWALEKNIRAIRFYERHGFHVTEHRVPEADTEEYLVWLERSSER